MNKGRTIWVVVGIVAALCLCAGLVSFLVVRELGSRVRNTIKTDPADVAEVSDSIAEFDVPPGYEMSMAMSLLNYDVVSLMPTSSTSADMTIMIMQFSMASANEEQMQEALKQQSNQPNVQMKVVEKRTEVIRGEEVTVTISEGTPTSSQTFTFRQWTTVFAGNNGPTILMIQGTTANWDEELIKDFIKSIH